MSLVTMLPLSPDRYANRRRRGHVARKELPRRNAHVKSPTRCRLLQAVLAQASTIEPPFIFLSSNTWRRS